VLALFDAAQKTSHLLALAVGPLVAPSDVDDGEKGLGVVEAMDEIGQLSEAVDNPNFEKLSAQPGQAQSDLNDNTPVVDI
jgi:hypothetical protein